MKVEMEFIDDSTICDSVVGITGYKKPVKNPTMLIQLLVDSSYV